MSGVAYASLFTGGDKPARPEEFGLAVRNAARLAAGP